MGDQPALRGLIVVGRHHQTGICSGGAGKPRQLDGLFGAVCAGACDDRTRPAALFTAKAIVWRCSSAVIVDASPVVPQVTSPATPLSICQSMSLP